MSERRPRGAWRIGRIAGADILIRPSLLVMGVLLVIVFAPQFERLGGNPYAVAGVFVASLYASILLHEIAHVVAARAFGMRVPSVTLHLLGGETHLEGESRSPTQEFVTAIVGPLASLVVGVAAWWSALQLPAGLIYAVLWSVGFINILVAGFNMLPGLPLDGGRVFRALIWGATGSESRGVLAAGWLGRLAAVGLVVWAVLTVDRLEPFHLTRALLFGVVAIFLWQGSSGALAHGRRLTRVDRIVARDLAVDAEPPPEAIALPASLSGRRLLIAMVEHPARVYALVEPDGTVVGRLDAASVDRAYREEMR
ncbi:site-2 protease family protein [Aeromicrobium piscarium]|uniref:Site-2 protease family protein n=1 Tax=Aeromicrobium piscarium TaxID=2590901 RepID=A0A554SFN3_9ACTN|nr:site-2 protease family protein [Aeromicrobium piscarium]TSD65154.1 site-2 protease family protein [Aeromicrobium piscarium]